MIQEPLILRREAMLPVAELVGAFTYALDMTEGQPPGHSLRACYIATRVAQALGIKGEPLGSVYYAALLKDLGCSSNAARLHELYKSDDIAFKHAFKFVEPGLPATLRFVFDKTAAGAPLRQRVAAIARILRNGDAIAQEMIVTRCTRGSDIARDLGFGEAVCEGIYHLDEHWDGGGRPGHLAGQAIPLPARLALLAQIADVFLQAGGPEAAKFEVARRAGSWLDPELAAAFVRLGEDPGLWRALASPALEATVAALAPAEERAVDDAFLDSITAAFGKVIDAKSPFTAGHSSRVAELAQGMGAHFDMLPARLAQLRRAAALHDVGKLGVSSAILEKPGKLDDLEWVQMREHAAHTRTILGRIGPLAALAELAAAHHERLDGAGYPLGLDERTLSRETRIITLCDFYDALTADRPYRAAMPRSKALAIMESEVGKAVDGACFEALRDLVAD
jgi:HD-GYP domain-containing protein (c-di-GMP phosphodiesterase class II)